MAQNPANVNYAYPPPAAPFTGPPNVNQAPAYPPAPGAGPPPASPVAQPPQAGPVGINPPSPYGQPPPPYAPSPYGAQSPSSPNVYGQHPQSPTPAAQPTVATKPPPKSRFCCCKYLTWVQTVSVIYLAMSSLAMLYFILIFATLKDCDEYRNRANREDAQKELVCVGGVGGTFGWLLPIFLYNIFEVVSAFVVKKSWIFRVRGVISSIVCGLWALALLGLSVGCLIGIGWMFIIMLIFLLLLWCVVLPFIILMGVYAYTLFRTAQCLQYEEEHGRAGEELGPLKQIS